MLPCPICERPLAWDVLALQAHLNAEHPDYTLEVAGMGSIVTGPMTDGMIPTVMHNHSPYELCPQGLYLPGETPPVFN